MAGTLMRAARIHEYGDAGVIRFEEIPRPVPGPGEVLVRMAATSFNVSEVGLRKGLLQGILDVSLPHTLGWDLAGTVEEIGPGVTGRAVGDTVYGLVGGTAAEYAVARADELAAAPAAIPLAHAAAVPVAGLTAWNAVVDEGRVGPGQRVLINGAGGAIGLFAVQLAKRAGAYVIATAGPRSREAVGRLGPDEVLDYTAEPLPGGMDVVLNLAAVPEAEAAALAPLGRLIVTAATRIDAPHARHFVTGNDPARLAELAALIDKGELIVDIAETHPLTALADLHRRAEAGRTRGKIIITF